MGSIPPQGGRRPKPGERDRSPLPLGTPYPGFHRPPFSGRGFKLAQRRSVVGHWIRGWLASNSLGHLSASLELCGHRATNPSRTALSQCPQRAGSIQPSSPLLQIGGAGQLPRPSAKGHRGLHSSGRQDPRRCSPGSAIFTPARHFRDLQASGNRGFD